MTTTKTSDLAARLKASATGSRAIGPSPSPSDLIGKAVEVQQTAPPAPAPFQAVRFQVNMSKEQHRFIRQFAFESDTDISTIIRLLLTRIEDEPVFAEEVRSQLANSE